jgi:hypothetical protein
VDLSPGPGQVYDEPAEDLDEVQPQRVDGRREDVEKEVP